MEKNYMVSWQRGIQLPEPVRFEYREECGKRTDAMYAEIYDVTMAEISAEKEKRARKFQRTHNKCGKMKDAGKSYERRGMWKYDRCGWINGDIINHRRGKIAERKIREDYLRSLSDAENELEDLIDAESFAESLMQSAINTLYTDDSEWSIDIAADEIREAVNQKHIAEYLRAGLEI